VDVLEFAAGDVLLLFAGGVVETFHNSYNRSFRTPAAWIGVKAEPRKHDQVRFTVGRADKRDQPVYGTGVSLSWTDVAFELDAAEEPLVRGFFSKVAQSAGRLGPA
jgi:hypothetical protein